MREKILIADDEIDIVSFMSNYFSAEGYEVITAYNGHDAIDRAADYPDIILLDVMMPLLDGFEVCRAIRERFDGPIIFLTARIEESDKLFGLGVGGDDYIEKPFSIEELGARVKAHMRREKRKHQPVHHKSFGQMYIDYGQRAVFYDQKILSFARKEYDIVELLSSHAGQVFSKQRIYERIWGLDADGDDNAVTEHIKRIRAKISVYTTQVYIETVWGVGYKWLRF